MRSLQYTSPGTVEVVERPLPEINEDQILVAARVVGVCHSDIDLLEGRYFLPLTFPVTPGHEWSGEVVRVGTRVRGFAPGDRVVGECVLSADEHFGFTQDGAASEFFVVKPEQLHKLPEGIDFRNGALVEPFSVGYYALMRTGNVNASDVLVVLGGGPVGLATVAGAHKLGATVICADPHENRRQTALALGAASAVHPEELAREVDVRTHGAGANVVIEVTGRPGAMAQALELVGFGGRVTYVGIDLGAESPARLGLIQSKELQVFGTIGSPGVWPETLRFIAQCDIDLSPLVTSVYSVEHAAEAVREAQNKTERTIKAHIEFSAVLD